MLTNADCYYKLPTAIVTRNPQIQLSEWRKQVTENCLLNLYVSNYLHVFHNSVNISSA